MPTGLNAEYDGDGNVLFKVSGARDFSSNNIIKSQYLSVNEGCYYHDGLHESPKSFVLDSNSKTGGSGSNVSYVISTPVRSYTVPTRYFDIYHNIALERNMSVSGLVLEQQTYKHATSRVNYSDGILIKPYTRPMDVVVEFDKWTKKNVVTWKRKEKAQDRYQDVDCLTDGTWYVLRYEKGQSATDYTVVDDIPGKNTNLKVADTDIEYDKEYVYRVVFLPDILEQKYSKDLIHLPGQSEKHNNYDLFEEAMANTTFLVGGTVIFEVGVPTAIECHVGFCAVGLFVHNQIIAIAHRSQAEFHSFGTRRTENHGASVASSSRHHSTRMFQITHPVP